MLCALAPHPFSPVTSSPACTEPAFPDTNTVLRKTCQSLTFPRSCPSIELQKANLEAQKNPNPSGGGGGGGAAGPQSSSSGSSNTTTSTPLANAAIPLAQLLTKPGALGALGGLASLSALGGLSELLAPGAATQPVQTTGVHRSHKSYQPKVRAPASGGASSGGGVASSKILKPERSKFAPY